MRRRARRARPPQRRPRRLAVGWGDVAVVVGVGGPAAAAGAPPGAPLPAAAHVRFVFPVQGAVVAVMHDNIVVHIVLDAAVPGVDAREVPIGVCLLVGAQYACVREPQGCGLWIKRLALGETKFVVCVRLLQLLRGPRSSLAPPPSPAHIQHTHTRKHTHTQAHTHASTHTRKHTHTSLRHTHTHTHTRTLTRPSDTHTHTHASTLTRTHTRPSGSCVRTGRR